jgi:4-hydroxybenzoate polyprenyltransferase
MLAANVFWAVAYDTEYAMVDRDDDIKIGIRSSALFFGRYDVVAIMFCYAAMLAILGGVGWAARLGWPFYIGLGVAAGIALYHYGLIRHRESNACFRAFLHNNWLGVAIFVGLVASYWVK